MVYMGIITLLDGPLDNVTGAPARNDWAAKIAIWFL